jgi:uncharacterized OB-fold protein
LTFCVYHAALASPAWEAEVPYIVAVVALAYSGVKILSNLICDETTVVRIGLPVKVQFDHVSNTISLPKFVPSLAATALVSG